MIYRLAANKDTFKPIVFGRGINFIVAERAPSASEQHSRNARGKTSILQAINYCLGGNRPSAFRALADDAWAFSLTLDLFGGQIEATRGLQSGGRLALRAIGGVMPPMVVDYLRDDGTIALQDWKFLLGLALFELDEEPAPGAQTLSPRTLISYVVRLDAPRDPAKIMAQQPAWSSREHVAFLLGLDWRYTHELSQLVKNEEVFEALQYAADKQLFPDIMGDESDLLLRRGEAEVEARELASRLASFTVLDDPDGTVNQADEVAARLTELTNDQVVDRRLLTLYESSLSEGDAPAEATTVGQLYGELGLAFSPEALRRFEQVAEFHETIASNRRRFLAAEVERINSSLVTRDREIHDLNVRRSGLLRQLASGGGIADLLELQRRVSEAESKAAALDESIRAVRSVQVSKDALKVRQATTRQDARTDLDRDRSFLDSVNARFNAMMRRLYDRSGAINVEIDDLGYKFTVKVSGSSSSGIMRMQLLCFDLTLMVTARVQRHPHFVIHDSILFDGVDPRQVAAGINLARDVVNEIDGQYIVTMNSNDVPEMIRDSKWYGESVRRTILDTEVGGGLGVVF